MTLNPFRKGRLAALTLAVLLLLAGTAAVGADSTGPRRADSFLLMSDIHFNPLYDPALAERLVAAPVPEWEAIFATSGKKQLGPVGQDSSWPLVKSALAEMKKRLPRPAFIVFPGDFLTHSFNQHYQQAVAQPTTAGFQALVAKTMQFLVGQIRATFPDAPVLPTLGNNDNDCGDYQLQPQGPFLEATLELARQMVGAAPDPAFDASWLAGGYYAVAHPTLPGVRVVSLNTVYLTPKFTNACGTAGSDPAGESLAWLGQTLEAARAAGDKVWLVQHVPPGMDSYSTANYGSCPSNLVTMYAPSYQEPFGKLIADHADIITATFAGHTHMDEFRLTGQDGKGTFVLGSPAVSAVFSENPGFRVYKVARSGTLLDQRTYYLKNVATAGPGVRPQWAREYDFRQTWGVDRIDLGTLQGLYRRIAVGGSDATRYFSLYNVSTPGVGGVTSANENAFVCAIGTVQTADYSACYCGPAPAADPIAPTASAGSEGPGRPMGM